MSSEAENVAAKRATLDKDSVVYRQVRTFSAACTTLKIIAFFNQLTAEAGA